MLSPTPNTIFFLLLFSFFLNNSSLLGQHPNYFIIGKTEFENADIYSILQTKNKELFVATNIGLYQYKHGKMSSISNADNQNGVSVFGLISNSKNEVFCYNLSGQILKVNERKLEVYFQIPKEYLTNTITTIFDDSDNLIIASKACFKVNDSKTIKLFTKSKVVSTISKLIDNRIILVQNSSDSCMVLKNDNLEYITSVSTKPILYSGKTFLIQDSIYNTRMLNQFLKSPPTNLRKNSYYEYTQLSKDEIWRRSSSSGIDVIKIGKKNLKIKNTFFKNTFISKIVKGENDLIFLGTFGKGLYVIPNRNAKSHSLGKLGTNMRGVCIDDKENIFIADRSNGIIHFKDTAKILDNDLEYLPENVFTTQAYIPRVNPKFKNLFYNKNLLIPSIKDIYTVDSTTILVASSGLLQKFGNGDILNKEDWKAHPILKDAYSFLNYSERCYSVVFEKETSTIYVAGATGLSKLKSKSIKEEITFEHKPIISRDLILYNGQLWCATFGSGILVFENGKFIKQINTQNQLQSDFIEKIHEQNDTLYISHKKGFQILDLKTFEIKTLGTAEGFINGASKDFAVGSGKLWYITNDELFSISKNNISKPIDLELSIDSIIIANQKIDTNFHSVFHYNENQLQCYINFSGIPYEKEAIIKYRLKGLEEKWNSLNIHSNLIEYKFLPDGNFNLEVVVHYRDFISEPLRYSFKIKKAFWQTLGFNIIGVIVILSLLSVIFFYRLRRIKKRNEKKLERQILKANLAKTELKALRSQMNPHFIFNALNSIQDLILQEDTEASYDYIVMFSNLVRNTLHYSNQNFISLEKEIEFLEIYLKLEKLRFNDSFNFSITSKLDKEISIPSLIVQPFVENAIVHGLFHKVCDKNLSILFERKNEFLVCKVIDNGVGRSNVKMIQERQGKVYTSFALEAITKRLSILQKQYGDEVGFSIKDANPNQKNKGTEVIITLPFLN